MLVKEASGGYPRHQQELQWLFVQNIFLSRLRVTFNYLWHCNMIGGTIHIYIYKLLLCYNTIRSHVRNDGELSYFVAKYPASPISNSNGFRRNKWSIHATNSCVERNLKITPCWWILWTPKSSFLLVINYNYTHTHSRQILPEYRIVTQKEH